MSASSGSPEALAIRFGYKSRDLSVAEDAYPRLISLPTFRGMSDHDVEDGITGVQKAVGYYLQ